MDNEKIFSSKKDLLKLLGIKENFLYQSFYKKYKEKDLPKKNGGYRKIKPPKYKLKIVQRYILDSILYKEKLLDCVFGLSKDKNILRNIQKHLENSNNQLVNLDIEDFFPSISRIKILRVFQSLGFNKENSSVLTKLCTVDNSLPQGAPTSPYLASLTCLKMDKEIHLYCHRRNFIYTRYFDDITISGKGLLLKNIEKIENIIKKHSFISNLSKKQFYDFEEEKLVNGISIKNNNLSVSKKYKEEIKTLYGEFLKNKDIKLKRVLDGKLGFYLYINKKEATEFIKNISK